LSREELLALVAAQAQVRAFTALGEVDARIRTLVTLAYTLCCHETPLRVGPKERRRCPAAGRVRPFDLRTAFEATTPTTRVYCCGPEPLLAAVEEMGSPTVRRDVHVERFAPKTVILAEPDHANCGWPTA
jgi:ferredoxin-NADP reductase